MQFRHIYRNNHPVATMAVDFRDEDRAVVSMARCNREAGDNYCKKTGRKIVEGRIGAIEPLVLDNIRDALSHLVVKCHPVEIPADQVAEFIKTVKMVIQSNSEKSLLNSANRQGEVRDS